MWNIRLPKRHKAHFAPVVFLGVFLFAIQAFAEETSTPSWLPEGFSIHGENSLLAALHRTGGAGDRTFLHRGEFLTDSLKLQIEMPLWADWKSYTDLHVRKTEDPQIDQRKDLHLLGLTSEIFNPEFKFTFGDFFGDFSQYTLSEALEGFQAQYKTERVELKGVAGIAQREDEGNNFKRYVYGGRSEFVLVPEYSFVKDFRVGFNFTDTEDDKGSIDNKTGVPEASNRVGSLNAQVLLWGISDWSMELGRSWIDLDERLGDVDRRTGTAFRLKNTSKWTKKLKTKFLYEWVASDFETLAGSAVPDRVNFTTSANYKWTKVWMSDVGYRVQYNHLDGSGADKRTTLHVPTASLTWTPEAADWILQDLYSRLYWEMRRRYSNEADSGQIDFTANEVGIEDEFKWKKFNWSAGWSLRDEDDDFQKTSSHWVQTGSLGVRTYRTFWGADWTPSLRWQMVYDDRSKEGGRDVRHVASTGLDVDISANLRFEQRYSIEIDKRLTQDSSSIKFNSYVGMEYKLPKLKNTTLKINYEYLQFAHDMATESFSEHNLQSELIWKF